MADPPRDDRGRFTKYKTTGAVVALGMAGVAGVSTGSVGAGGAASVESALGQAVRANVSKSKGHARKGKRDDAWREVGLKRVNEISRPAASCAVNSYGDVRQFFLRTPCRSLDRMLFVLGDGRGGSIVVSVAWVLIVRYCAGR